MIIIFLACFLLFFSSQVNALSATPSSFDVDYISGKTDTFSIRIDGVQDVDITFKGDAGDYAKVKNIQNNNNYLMATIEFTMPSNPEPGQHEVMVFISEIPSEREYGQKMINVLSAVQVPIRFYLPYPHKFLQFKKIEWDQEVKKGQTLFFNVNLHSLGEETINQVTGKVNIENGDQTYEAKLTSIYNVKLDQEIKLLGEWTPPENAPLGRYSITGEIDYDGQKVSIPERKFSYGDEMLEILSVDPLEILISEITQMEIAVKNYWNQPLPFSATLTVLDANQSVISESKSSTEEIGAKSEKEIIAFVDATTWKAGTYPMEVRLNYQGKESTKTFQLNAVIEKEGVPLLIIAILIMNLIVMVILGIIAKHYYHKSKNEQQT